MELDQWARGQAEIFGTEAVWTFEPRSLSGGPPNRPALFRFWAGFALGLLSLAVWGSILLLVDDKEKGVPLIVLSVMGSMFCTLPLALNWVSGSRKLGGTPSTFGLVIAPQGLAMVTETHRGILAWPDVVRLRDRPPTLQLSREDQRRVLQLDVRGASILIQDRWNAPLIVIRRLIESNLMARDPSAPASN